MQDLGQAKKVPVILNQKHPHKPGTEPALNLKHKLFGDNFQEQ